MSNRILISVQDGVKEPDWINNVEQFCIKTLDELKFDGEEVSILFCNDTYIQELNKNYRNIDSATDVLSFENDEEYEDDLSYLMQHLSITLLTNYESKRENGEVLYIFLRGDNTWLIQ